MPDLPARFAALIITFAPLFVQRLWLHARVLLIEVAPDRWLLLTLRGWRPIDSGR